MVQEEAPFVAARAKLVRVRLELLRQLMQFQPEELTFSANPAEWSPLQVAYHIYLTDEILLQCTRQIQEEENPLMVSIGEEHSRLVHETGHQLPFATVLDGMVTRREALLNYLASLPATAWERPLRHALRGNLRFDQWIDMLPEHDLKHIRQLADMRAVQD